MERETKQTKRQEWNDYSDCVQEDVNNTLGKAHEVIEVANAMLADKYSNNSSDLNESVVEVIERLNSIWDYDGDIFHITGKWHEPVVDVSEDGILVSHRKGEAFNSTVSNGFMVKVIEDEHGITRPVVGLSFIEGAAPYFSPAMRGNFNILAFAEPREVSLQYMRPGDSSVVSSELTEVGETIMRADSLLRLYTSHAGSELFRQSAKKQEEFFRSIIDQVDEALPSPETFDRVVLNEVKSTLLCVKPSGASDLAYVYPPDDSLFVITGSVVGVTITDVLKDGFGKRYKSPDEMESAEEGLSLIVKPDGVNFNLPDELEGCDLIMPLSTIIKLEMTVE
ncbi:hypothetical protein H6796_00590 [Candidatus Nomurabacteria bacterium]|nr:hypothetical protein [Candidatus Nomurabacteria bacterium]